MSRKSAPLTSEFWESYTKPKKIWFHTNDAIQDFEHFTDDLITTDLQTALYAAKMRRVMALINPKTQQIMEENSCVLKLINEGTEIEGKATNKNGTKIKVWVHFADEYEAYLGGYSIRGLQEGSEFPIREVESPHPQKLAELIDSSYQYLFQDGESRRTI